MAELKPCPFCKDGGKPYVLTGKCYTFENGIGSKVECEKCLSSGPLCNTEEDAISAWNQRAMPIPDTPEMVRALDDAYEAGIKSVERTCHGVPYKGELKCSECDLPWEYDYNYCPECGSKVVE